MFHEESASKNVSHRDEETRPRRGGTPNTTSQRCEGGVDVVGVVTPLVGGVAQASHDDRVVELSVQLEVQEVEGKEEDREGQVEVEEERGELKEKRT